MDGTILSQGSFTTPGTNTANNTTAAGSNQIIAIPSNADWMKVFNYTKQGVVGTASPIGIEFYWQRGMALGTGIVRYYSNGSAIINGDTLASGGFTLFDSSGQASGSMALVGAAVATTASTNATRPVVSTGTTTGLAVGSVVRLSNTAQTDVNGIDMVVGAVSAGVSFTLLTATNALATAPGAIGGAGFYRQVNVDSMFYPRNRYVVNITQAVNANVGTSIAHGLTPGQLVRFSIPVLTIGAAGMTQLNGQSATVVSVVDDYNFTINVDTTAYSAFVWPTIAQGPSSFPQVIPFGEDSASSLASLNAQVPTISGVQINNTQTGLLADATVNTGFLGMVLGTGGLGTITGAAIIGPSGTITNATNVQTPDTMYWVAGKSSFGGL